MHTAESGFLNFMIEYLSEIECENYLSLFRQYLGGFKFNI